MRTIVLLALALLAGCAPSKNTPLAEIPKLTSLEDVMDNQASAADPQFAKIGHATFTDEDFAALGLAAERLQATSLKTKDFAKGREAFETLAGRLNEKAKALGTAAGAKDAAGVNAALGEVKATCKECHAKFR